MKSEPQCCRCSLLRRVVATVLVAGIVLAGPCIVADKSELEVSLNKINSSLNPNLIHPSHIQAAASGSASARSSSSTPPCASSSNDSLPPTLCLRPPRQHHLFAEAGMGACASTGESAGVLLMAHAGASMKTAAVAGLATHTTSVSSMLVTEAAGMSAVAHPMLRTGALANNTAGLTAQAVVVVGALVTEQAGTSTATLPMVGAAAPAAGGKLGDRSAAVGDGPEFPDCVSECLARGGHALPFGNACTRRGPVPCGYDVSRYVHLPAGCWNHYGSHGGRKGVCVIQTSTPSQVHVRPGYPGLPSPHHAAMASTSRELHRQPDPQCQRQEKPDFVKVSASSTSRTTYRTQASIGDDRYGCFVQCDSEVVILVPQDSPLRVDALSFLMRLDEIQSHRSPTTVIHKGRICLVQPKLLQLGPPGDLMATSPTVVGLHRRCFLGLIFYAGLFVSWVFGATHRYATLLCLECTSWDHVISVFVICP